MKTYVSPALLAHMGSPAPTLAWCWIVKRTDGFVYAVTTHVEDHFAISRIPDLPGIDGQPDGAVLCHASPGISITDIATSDSLAQSNLDIESVLDDLGITEEDVRAGLWKNAKLEICIVNYLDASMGSNTTFFGSLGAFTGGDISIKVEQRGITNPLDAQMDGLVGPMCRVKLGGPKCGVDLTPFLRTGTMATTTADRMFTDTSRTEADDWWTKGQITITSGDATGQVFDIKHSTSDGTIELVDEVFRGIRAGDTYIISPGCNHLLKVATFTTNDQGERIVAVDGDGNTIYAYTGDCKVKFDNVRRFWGEPEVPGQVAINQFGGQSVQ